MSRPQPFPGHAATTAAPGLEFRYAAADTLPRQLADDRVLAVLGFGSSAPANDDPRWLRVPLQPLDDAQRAQHTQTCIDACLQDPRWRLSLQTHKITGIR